MKTEAPIPEKFNWVKARSECSIARVFTSLFQGIEDDIKEMNPLRKEVFSGYPTSPFDVHVSESGDYFVVYREDNIHNQVKFKRNDDHIIVKHSQGETTITLTLDDAGKCKLRLDGRDQALEQWQVRRRFLEPLFFGEAMPSVPQK
jgi:hypothetical protein